MSTTSLFLRRCSESKKDLQEARDVVDIEAIEDHPYILQMFLDIPTDHNARAIVMFIDLLPYQATLCIRRS